MGPRRRTWLVVCAVAAGVTACSSSSSPVVRGGSPSSSVAPSSSVTSSIASPSVTPSTTASSVASSTGARGRPAATVTPSTGLRSVQIVHVRGTGFTAGEALTVVQCAAKGAATGPGDCNLTGMLAVTADSAGRVAVDLRVLRGPFGANKIVCGPSRACLVSITQASLAPTEEADVPIRFAAA